MQTVNCIKCGSTDIALGKSPLVDLSNGPLCRKCYHTAYKSAYYAMDPKKRKDLTVKERMAKYVDGNRHLINLKNKLRYYKRRLDEVDDPVKVSKLLAKQASITEELELLVGS